MILLKFLKKSKEVTLHLEHARMTGDRKLQDRFILDAGSICDELRKEIEQYLKHEVVE